MTSHEIFLKLIDSSPLLGPMLVLVWILKTGNDKMVAQLNTERQERLDGMDKQIEHLLRRSDECEKDRLALHRDNAALREQLEALRTSRGESPKRKVA